MTESAIEQLKEDSDGSLLERFMRNGRANIETGYLAEKWYQ
jgi:hypothetical protein